MSGVYRKQSKTPSPSIRRRRWLGTADTGNNSPDQSTLLVTSYNFNWISVEGDVFNDVDGDSHAATQFQITLAADTGFASPVEDYTKTTGNLYVYTFNGLLASTEYRMRLRYKDDSGDPATEWGAWSTVSYPATITTDPYPIWVWAQGSNKIIGAVL